MKVIMVGDVQFEAKSTDEALLKLAVHFLSQMKGRPQFIIKNQPPLDAIGTMINTFPHLDVSSTAGYIDVEFLGNHPPPEMMQ